LSVRCIPSYVALRGNFFLTLANELGEELASRVLVAAADGSGMLHCSWPELADSLSSCHVIILVLPDFRGISEKDAFPGSDPSGMVIAVGERELVQRLLASRASELDMFQQYPHKLPDKSPWLEPSDPLTPLTAWLALHKDEELSQHSAEDAGNDPDGEEPSAPEVLGRDRDRANCTHPAADNVSAMSGPQVNMAHESVSRASATCESLDEEELQQTQENELLPVAHLRSGFQEPHHQADSSNICDKDEQLEDEEIKVAKAESEREAVEQENSNVIQALLLSKPEQPEPLSADEVVLLRLNQYNQEVGAMIASCSELEECRGLVREAGCELSPSWANGAHLLVPLTEWNILETGLVLAVHHVLICCPDVSRFRQALQRLPRKVRPKVRYDHRADYSCTQMPQRVSTPRSTSSLEEGHHGNKLPATTSDPDDNVSFEEVRTFIHFPLPIDCSEASEVACSAPTGGEKEPENPRRWKLRCLSGPA